MRKRKEKKKKRNINNDLAVLPSHDRRLFLRQTLPLGDLLWCRGSVIAKS